MLWKLSCCYQPLEQCSKCNPDHPQNIVAQTRTAHFYFPPSGSIKIVATSLWNLPDLLFFFPPVPHSFILLSFSPHWCVSTAHSWTIWRSVRVCMCWGWQAIWLSLGVTVREAGGVTQILQPAHACLLIWSTFSGHCLIQILNIKVKPQKVIGHNMFV